MTYTSCVAGRSVSHRDGLQVRAKTSGLSHARAQALEVFCTYQAPDGVAHTDGPSSAPARLAFLTTKQATVVVHSVHAPSNRTGSSFSHLLVDMPSTFGAMDAVALWNSPFWQREDDEQESVLDSLEAPPVPCVDWWARLPSALVEARDSAIAICVLGAFLGLESSGRLFLVAPPEEAAGLIALLAHATPAGWTSNLTFSTYENRPLNAPATVVATWPGPANRLPAGCSASGSVVIDTTIDLEESTAPGTLYARSSIDALRRGDRGMLDRLKAVCEALGPGDARGADLAASVLDGGQLLEDLPPNDRHHPVVLEAAAQNGLATLVLAVQSLDRTAGLPRLRASGVEEALHREWPASMVTALKTNDADAIGVLRTIRERLLPGPERTDAMTEVLQDLDLAEITPDQRSFVLRSAQSSAAQDALMSGKWPAGRDDLVELLAMDLVTAVASAGLIRSMQDSGDRDVTLFRMIASRPDLLTAFLERCDKQAEPSFKREMVEALTKVSPGIVKELRKLVDGDLGNLLDVKMTLSDPAKAEHALEQRNYKGWSSADRDALFQHSLRNADVVRFLTDRHYRENLEECGRRTSPKAKPLVTALKALESFRQRLRNGVSAKDVTRAYHKLPPALRAKAGESAAVELIKIWRSSGSRWAASEFRKFMESMDDDNALPVELLEELSHDKAWRANVELRMAVVCVCENAACRSDDSVRKDALHVIALRCMSKRSFLGRS